MEKFLTLEYGVGGICVLITLQVLMRVAEFIWKMREKKETQSEETMKKLIETGENLNARLASIEKSLAELPKFKTDLRRYFNAVRLLSGEKWPEIRKQIMEEEL